MNIEFYPAIWYNTDTNFHKSEVKDRETAELAKECGITVVRLRKKNRALGTRFRKVSVLLLIKLTQ